METDSPEETPKTRVPLSLVLEGKSWILTALIEATIALWMVSLAVDGYGFFIHMLDLSGNWAQELLSYLMYMAVGALAAGIAVGALSLNFRPVESKTWRKRSCRSTFALIIIDMMAIDHLGNVCIHWNKDDDNSTEERFASLLATTFLSVVGTGCTIYFNIIFIREFGCCVCCRNESVGEGLVEKTQAWLPTKELPVAEVVQEDSQKKSTSQPQSNEPETNESEKKEGYSPPTESNIEIRTESTNSSGNSSSKPRLVRWNTRNLIHLGSLHASLNSGVSTVRSIAEDDILAASKADVSTEAESSRAASRRPSRAWSAVPDVSKIVQKFLATNDQSIFSSIRSANSPLLALWQSLKEEPGRFRYAVWIKSAFLTSVVVLIYACIRTLAIIFSLVDDYEKNRERIIENMKELDGFLLDSGWVDGVDSVARMTSIKLYLLVDRVVIDYRWTALAGYPLGTMFGLYGLVAVLIQHKRLSLAVSESLKMFDSQANEEHSKNEHWLEFRKKYPIVGAWFFLAILSSTAVLQAQIVGFVISVLLGMLFNFSQLQVILEHFGYVLLAYLIMLAIDVVVHHFLHSSLMTEDGYGIQHPRWFNFFMVVLSMVHLVIGILYALWRVLYLLVTTVFVLNRLDVCLFTFGKSLDNGHNAFMSMLVLTVLIQQDSKSHIHKTRSDQRSDSL